jgi:hypothetical protein
MKKIIYLRDYLDDLYLDCVNNILSIAVFAEYYGLDEDDDNTNEAAHDNNSD